MKASQHPPTCSGDPPSRHLRTHLHQPLHFDYVYWREELAGLAGRRYHGKRNLIAKCLEQHDCIYEDISPGNVSEVAKMMDLWCSRRNCGKDVGLCHEYLAVQELFAHYAKVGVVGAAIRIKGEIAAFTVGDRLNSITAVVHFEKAMPEVQGPYQVINQWFCRNRLSGFEFINREQDLGIDGLRQTKESNFPDHLVKQFRLQRADETLSPPPSLERCAQ